MHTRWSGQALPSVSEPDTVAEAAELVRSGGRVSIERITTCSCRTRLCSTLARIASGAVSLPRSRKIAVPGICRSGGCHVCSS